VLRLLKELNPDKITKLSRKMVELAADGEIDDSEMDEFMEVMDEIDDIQYALSEMKLAGKKILKRRKG